MFRLMSFYGNDETKFRKIGDFVFNSERSSGLLRDAPERFRFLNAEQFGTLSGVQPINRFLLGRARNR